MRSIKDLTGMKFNLLTVLRQDGKNSVGKVRWLCLCDCGNHATVTGNNLKAKRGTKSCGCYRNKFLVPFVTKHPNVYRHREDGVTEMDVKSGDDTFLVLIDTASYDAVKDFQWRIRKNLDGRMYVISKHHIRLHHVVLGKKTETDHINSNSLDNRKDNLRAVSHSQNCMNTRKQRRQTSSRFKGVSWDKKAKKWSVEITLNQKTISCGCYRDEELAARAYDEAARELFGEYCRVNFPLNGEQPALPLAA